MTTDTREDSVYLAKLAEQAERYEGTSNPSPLCRRTGGRAQSTEESSPRSSAISSRVVADRPSCPTQS